MRLPDDLPAPDDPYLRTVLEVDLALLDLVGRLAAHWTSHASANGLTGAQIKVLLALRADDAVPMREVAARLDYDASNLTTLVERLRDRGLLDRLDDPADRRRKTLRLTPAGLTARDRFWTGLTTDPGPLTGITHPDLRQLAALLRPFAQPAKAISASETSSSPS